MNITSLSTECAKENMSDNRLICQDTLEEIAKSDIAGKTSDRLINTGTNNLGKLSRKLGFTRFSRAAKSALKALGPTGKVIDSWNFGRMVGTQFSKLWIEPRLEQYLRDKSREEAKKIRQQTELLKADKAVAREFRKLLKDRGVDAANAYLDNQFEVANQDAGLIYDVKKEIDRGKKIRLAKEEKVRRRNIERESPTGMPSGSTGAEPTGPGSVQTPARGRGSGAGPDFPDSDEGVAGTGSNQLSPGDPDEIAFCQRVMVEAQDQVQATCSYLERKLETWTNSLPQPHEHQPCLSVAYLAKVRAGVARSNEVCADLLEDPDLKRCYIAAADHYRLLSQQDAETARMLGGCYSKSDLATLKIPF